MRDGAFDRGFTLARMQTRDAREARLMMARRRLDTANDVLRTAHGMAHDHEPDSDGADSIQRAQELVITIEQEVALLTNGLDRNYADSDTSRASGRP
jgi:hypothetical protein